MALLIRTHFNLAKSSIKRNKCRSFLTCLGIAIGVASIILILSLMGSITNLISSEVKSIGSDLIVIRPSTNHDAVTSIVDELTTSTQYLSSNLTLTDVETAKSLENIEFAAPIAVSVNTLSGTSTVDSGTVVATTSDFFKVQSFPLASGVLFEESSQPNSVVIGNSLATQLYGANQPIGKTLTIFGEKFFITGVLSKTDDPINFNNIDIDNSAFVNISYLAELGKTSQIQQINLKAKTTENLSETVEKLKETLKSTKSDTNFSVLYGDEITHPAGSLLSIVSGILALVAGISLVVGGVGVMNIMLVSVSERTHEIGIRKAIGASTQNILSQFLFEALILSISGGIFGLILGYVIAFFICLVTPFAPYISLPIVFIAFLTSFFVGIAFGLYPALKAAHKNPIYSLKFFN